MRLFHSSSDQRREDTNWSEDNLYSEVDYHDKEDKLIFFDTSYSEMEYFPGSTSVQFLSPICILLVDELEDSQP